MCFVKKNDVDVQATYERMKFAEFVGYAVSIPVDDFDYALFERTLRKVAIVVVIMFFGSSKVDIAERSSVSREIIV